MDLKEGNIVHSRVYEDKMVSAPYRVPMGMSAGRIKYCQDKNYELRTTASLPDNLQDELIERI